MSYLGKEVVTEYSSDSQYVSSEEHYTPFPSLTMSKKIELEKYIHNGEVTYNISTFSEPDVIEPERIATQRIPSESRESLTRSLRSLSSEQQQPESVNKESIIGCCLLL